MGRRKINILGHEYRLERIGEWSELWGLAKPILASVGWAKIQTTIHYADNTCYHFAWYHNWQGSPVYVMVATKAQVSTWRELRRYRGKKKGPALMWVRTTLPNPLYCDGPCYHCDGKKLEVWVDAES